MGLISWLQGMFAGRGAEGLADLAALLRGRMEGPGGLILQPRQRAAYDRLVDALSRLPRPVMALGTLALLAAAIIAPDWFADRMQALSLMPEPLWWLVGAVISLWFGARLQTQDQAFQRELVERILTVPPAPPAGPGTPLAASAGGEAQVALSAETPGPNPALTEWRLRQP